MRPVRTGLSLYTKNQPPKAAPAKTACQAQDFGSPLFGYLTLGGRTGSGRHRPSPRGQPAEIRRVSSTLVL
jgi:hypothetical protein